MYPVDWQVPMFWSNLVPQKVIKIYQSARRNILQDLNLQDGMYLDRILCFI